MDKGLLEDCVVTLKAFRTQKHEELGTSVTAELDDVITRLEHCLETANGGVRVGRELAGSVLEVLARCLKLVTNLSEIIHWYLGPR